MAILAIVVSTLTGCKKETTTVDDSAKYDAQLIIDDADNAYNNSTINEGSETTEFSADNEGLPEAYTIVETDMDDAGYKRANVKRIFVCLLKLDLNDSQIAKIRRHVRAYEACKAYDIQKHREAYAKLVIRVEALRKEYLAQLNNGKITKAQFAAKMKDLRADFEQSLKEIRISFAKNLKACYDKFMRSLKEILTDRQWKAFVDCYR
jgi:hypothetical protein